MISDGLFDYDPPRVLNTTTASRMELKLLVAEGLGVSSESVFKAVHAHSLRESVLFIGTQFSILYTSMYDETEPEPSLRTT